MYETFSKVGDPALAGSPPFFGARTRFFGGRTPLKNELHYAIMTYIRLESITRPTRRFP